MDLIILTEDNISEYKEYMTEDVAENIGRTYFQGIIVTDGDQPVSGMVWEYTNILKDDDKESHIIWMKADSEEAAGPLFTKYNELIKESEAKRSTFTLPAKASKIEKQILKEQGFTVKLTEGDKITARLSEISEIPFLKKVKLSDSVNPLKFVTQRGFNSAIRRMMSMGHYGLCEDLAYLPRSYFENDVSCYSEEEGIINGLFLCHKTPSEKLTIVLMATMGKDGAKLIPYLIGNALLSANEMYPPETEVVIDRHNYASLALGEKLFPRGFGIPIYTGERAE